MFNSLSEKLEAAFKNLKGQARINELNIANTVKDIRRALVDADVNYKIAKEFTDRVKDRLKLDFARSNVLEIEGDTLTGRMVDQPWGDIVDGEEKRRTLLQTCEQLGIAPGQTIAVGDGANDLPMMGVAGLSVAYHAKPAVRTQAKVSIEQGGMDRLLELLS